MIMQDIFLVGVFSVVGLAIFMFFLLGIVEAICEYKLRRDKVDE